MPFGDALARGSQAALEVQQPSVLLEEEDVRLFPTRETPSARPVSFQGHGLIEQHAVLPQ